jgi:hypothetical protein
MSVNLDSEALFQARCKEVGMEDAVFDKIKAAKYSTYAAFAYCSSFVPGNTDEVPFITVMKECLQRDPTGPELSILRRLIAESHTFVLSDMRAKLEQRDDSAPRRMAVPERKVRLQQQQERLGEAISISGSLEPSYWLIDEVEQQREDSVLRWIPAEKCCSRTQELQGEKKESQYQFDPVNGIFKIKGAANAEKADLSIELLVRNSFVRRSLAYDQSGLLSYTVSMTWIDSLFTRAHAPSIPGYQQVSMLQCMSADKELWILLSEALRGALVPVTGTGKKPLDEKFAALAQDHRVAFLLLPLPISRQQNQNKNSNNGEEEHEGKRKGDGKGKRKPTKKGNITKDGQTTMPAELQGYSAQTPEGKYICWNFNLAKGCKFAKPGGRCKRGVHVCIKCFSKAHCLGGC